MEEIKYVVNAYIKTNRYCVAGIHTFVGNIVKIYKWLKENTDEEGKGWDIAADVEKDGKFDKWDKDGNHVVVRKYTK